MADAVLKIELVNGDPELQKLLDGSAEYRPPQDANPTMPTAAPSAPSPPGVEPPPAPPVAPPVVPPPVPPPLAPPVPNVADVVAGAQSTQDRAINSIDELTKRIGELIELEISAKTKPKDEQQPKDERPNTAFGRLVDRIDRFVRSTEQAINRGMGRFGKTRAGKAVSAGVSRVRKAATSAGKAFAKTRIGRVAVQASKTVGNAAKRVGSRIAATRAGKAVAGVLGRTAATGAAGSATGAGAAGAGTVAAVAAPIAVFTLAVGAAALTVKGFADAIHSAAGDLADLSPALASVKANFEVTRELQRLDRANRIGAGAAQLEAARGRINESMYEVQTKILEVILKFSPLIEGVLDAVNAGLRGVDLIVAVLNVITSRIDDFIPGGAGPANNQAADDAAAKAAAALAQALAEIFQNNPGDQFNGIDPMLRDVLTMGFGGPGAGPRMPRNQGNFP